MPPNRITRGGATARALILALALIAVAVALAACGGSSSTAGTTTSATFTATPSAEESADASILGTVLARQQAAIDADAAAIPHLDPANARMATNFRTQEQEHVDGVLRAIRGLISPAEPTPEEIVPPEAKTETEWLVFLYEVESKTIDKELGAVAGLESGSPRSMIAATVANQAQHLTLLRQALGAGPAAQVPVPFEDGTAPAP